jgi:hypothetical protein
LDRESPGSDSILGQAELLERGASSNLNLSRNNVDSADLFGNCMLYLKFRAKCEHQRARKGVVDLPGVLHEQLT